MVGRLAVIALAGLAACGRFGFGDVSSRDASTIGDGTGDAPACSAQFDVCDGFETAAIDPSLWATFGAVTRDTTVAHRGAASLHFHIDALGAGQSGEAAIAETRTLATATPTFWVRAWLRLSALPSGTNGLVVMSAGQTMNPYTGVYLFVHATDTQLYSDFDFQVADGPLAPPVDTWFCLIWNVVPQVSNTGSLHLTSDAITALALDNTVTNSAPPIHAIELGPRFDSPNVDVAQPALDAWIDDVIVDTTAITCDE